MPARVTHHAFFLLCSGLFTLLLASTLAPDVAAAAPANAPEVSAAGPNVLIRPSTPLPATQNRVQLAAARGEFESAQIVIRAKSRALTDVDVAIDGALKNAQGSVIPANAFTIYRVGYYNVTGFTSDGDLGGAMGLFPDALIPKIDSIWGEERNAFPITIPAEENRLAWVDLLVPAGQAPGVYTGARVKVTAAGYEPAYLPIRVEVSNATLPSTSNLGGGFDLDVNKLCAAHNCNALPGKRQELHSIYSRVALDNRLTLAKPPAAPLKGVSERDYKAYTEPLINGTAATRLQGAKLRTITIYQWDRESAGEWRKRAEAGDFTQMIRFHCDEIGDLRSSWESCERDWRYANKLWHDAVAKPVHDLPLQVTTDIGAIRWANSAGFADFTSRISTLIPVINYLHPKEPVRAFPGTRGEYAAWNSGATKAGAGNSSATPMKGGAQKELWSYTSCMSMGCSPADSNHHPLWSGWASYGVDQPASEARAMGLISYTYDLSGEYYYETARDLPTAWTNLWSIDGGNHGDGTFFYPGTVNRIGGQHDTAIESIRLKRVRDGREDYELALLAEKNMGRNAVVAKVRELFPTLYQTTNTQGNISAVRRTLFTWASGTFPAATWSDTERSAVTLAPLEGYLPEPDPVPAAPQEPAPSAPQPSPAEPPPTPAAHTALVAGTQSSSAARDIRAAKPAKKPAKKPVKKAAKKPAKKTTKPKINIIRGGKSKRPKRAVWCKGYRATIVGTPGNDLIIGTPGRDVIVTYGGNDRVIGMGGGDIICTGPGQTQVFTHTGKKNRRDIVYCHRFGRDSVTHDKRDLLRGRCNKRIKRG